MAFRIAQLEHRAFASSLKDRAVKDDGPSLFAGLDGEAQLAAAQKLEEASRG